MRGQRPKPLDERAIFLLIKKAPKKGAFQSTPGRARTPNLLVRSQTLYPIELRAHFKIGAAGQGFEPRLPGPEPGVLPLDDPANKLTNLRINIFLVKYGAIFI